MVRVHEPESTAGVSSLVRDGTCELGLAPLPLRTQGLRTLALGEQELLFVLPPGGALPHDARARDAASDEPLAAAASDEPLAAAASDQPLAAAALREIPLVVSPPGTSTRALLEQALAAVGVSPQIAVETAAREAIVPLVLAGAGAALLPAPLAREAERRGAVARAARPRILRRIGSCTARIRFRRPPARCSRSCAHSAGRGVGHSVAG